MRCLWFLQSTPARIHFDTKTIENLLSSCQNEFGPVHIVTAFSSLFITVTSWSHESKDNAVCDVLWGEEKTE
jgi:hypothetical protein